MTRPRRLGLVAAALAVAAVAAACQPGTTVGQREVERVLVVSLPGVTWGDVDAGQLPTLRALAADAAIGDLSTRIGRRGASTTDAYLSIGAGTRAIAPRVDVAVAVDPDESYGGVPTADILQRRLGRVPTGIAYLPVGAAIDRNETSGFGAEPGRLGDLLAAAGVHRAVVANADAAEGFVSDEPPPDGAYARSAATALMGSDGIVPGGTVGRSLLVDDPDAPFGRRLDHRAVLAAVDQEWARPGRTVLLVEASDLLRADAYEARATPEHAHELRAEAVERADALLAALVERIDPDRDALLVISPVATAGRPELGVALLDAPGVGPGLLRSATTRRDGYVQLADVAPTILRLLGEPQPEEIEGRAFQVRATERGGRIERLAAQAEAAGFRDHLMPIVVPVIIALLAALTAAVVLARRLAVAGSPPRWQPLLRLAALAALGVVPATFLAARSRSLVGSTLEYLLAVAVLAVALAVACWAVDRRRPGWGPLVGLGAIVLLVAVDVVLGAPLQLNAVFGYSVAVAGRFAGLGNLAFALFGAAVIVVAALIVERSGRRGLPWAAALLGTAVLLEGLPMLGADVGGVLSMVPAFGVTLLVLAGRRVRGIDLLGLVAAGGLAVLAFAFVDVSRSAGSRTHLARLAEHLVEGRWGPFVDSLTRRLDASFGNAEIGAWALVGGLAVGVGTYVVLLTQGRIDTDRLLSPERRPVTAAAAGLAVLAVLGLVANDSSIAVPTTMLVVVVPVLVLRAIPDGARTARADLEPA